MIHTQRTFLFQSRSEKSGPVFLAHLGLSWPGNGVVECPLMTKKTFRVSAGRFQTASKTLFAVLFFILSSCGSQPTLDEPPAAESQNTESTVVQPAPSLPLPTQTPMASPTATPASQQLSETAAPPIFGLETNKISLFEGYELIQELDIHWLRKNGVLWSRVEPEEGARRWEALESLELELELASLSGHEVILIVRGTPPWAQAVAGSFCGPILPEKLAAFGAFLFDLVSRYSQPPYNVHYWELWNEPDIEPSLQPPNSVFGCWGDEGDPYYGGEYYAEMLKAVYPQIKAADPQARVLVGGLLLDCDPRNPPETPPASGQYKDCSPSRFLEGVLLNGGGDSFDGVSFHAYDYYLGAAGQYGNPNWRYALNTTGPVTTIKADYIRELLSQYGVTGKFLMNTENALICGRDGNEPVCQTDDFHYTKANYLVRSFAASFASGLDANIWFNLGGWRASGLVNPNNLEPLLAYKAYDFLTHELHGAQYQGKITDFPGIEGVKFVRDGVQIWLLWSADGNTQTIQLPASPTLIYDTYGGQLPITSELSVTQAPIYTEWE